MKLYTSYYANIKNLPKEFKLVSISGNIPEAIRDTVDIWDKRFAPNWDLLKEYKNSTQDLEAEHLYIKRFKAEVLSKINFTEILKSWTDKFGIDETYVLLCYEKPEDFCHRNIVAEALENKYDIKIQEYGINIERKEYKHKQTENLTNW